MTDEQIDHLIAALNSLLVRPIDYQLISWSAVDHIDAVLRDVPPGQRADVDKLLGRRRISIDEAQQAGEKAFRIAAERMKPLPICYVEYLAAYDAAKTSQEE